MNDTEELSIHAPDKSVDTSENEKAAPTALTAGHGEVAEAVGSSSDKLPTGHVNDKLEGPKVNVNDADSSLLKQILAARKAPSEVSQPLKTGREILSVPLYKMPPKHLFWQAKPSEPPLIFDLLKYKGETDIGFQFYLITDPHLAEELASDLRFRNMISAYELTPIVDVKGNFAFCCISCNTGNVWIDSARDAVADIESRWGRVLNSGSAYEVRFADEDLGDPLWPTESMDALLLKAFKSHAIDSHDHPILKNLRGQIS